MFPTRFVEAARSRWISAILLMLALVGGLAISLAPAQGTSTPAPDALNGEAVSTGLSITWEAPDTSGGNIAGTIVGYEIQRKTGDETDFSVLVDSTASTETSYIDTSGGSDYSFIAGQQYTYRVKAIYTSSNGTVYRSDPSSAETITVPNYLAPTGFGGEDRVLGPYLEWDAPTISWSSNRAGHSGYWLKITPPTHGVRNTTPGVNDTSHQYLASEYGDHTFELSAVYGVFKSQPATTTVTVAE